MLGPFENLALVLQQAHAVADKRSTGAFGIVIRGLAAVVKRISGLALRDRGIKFRDFPNAFRLGGMRPGNECSADFRPVPA
jgi:hypothetical protein